MEKIAGEHAWRGAQGLVYDAHYTPMERYSVGYRIDTSRVQDNGPAGDTNMGISI